MSIRKPEAYFPFWDKISDQEKESLLPSVKEVHLQTKDLLISTQQRCLGLILVKSGALRVFILSESGREVNLFTMKPGEVCVLTATCLLDEFNFPIHIATVEDSVIYSIPHETFSPLADRNVYVENFMYKVALKRFSQIMWIIEDILFTKVDRRLAQILLEESKTGPTIKTTHESLAHRIATAREVVSRMLKYFAQEGWIELKRGQITVIDRPALKAI